MNSSDIRKIVFSSINENPSLPCLINYTKKYHTTLVTQRNDIFFECNYFGKINEITIIIGPVIKYIIQLIYIV